MSASPRKTMMSFVIPIPRVSDPHQSVADQFRKRIIEHNVNQGELSRIKARHAPMYIAELRFRRECDHIHGLAKTDGDQFQFTRWYEFLNAVFGFIETMSVPDKVAQISEFRNHLRVLSGDAVLNFDVPGTSRLSLGKRGYDAREDGGAPAPKQLCLSGAGGSYRPVETRVDGAQTKSMQQTMLVGGQSLKQTFSSDGASRQDSSIPASIFMPNPDAVVRLCEFLSDKVYKTLPVVDVIPGESKANEHKRKKKAWSIAPLVMRAVARFLPPFTTTNQVWAEISMKLPAGQAMELAEVNQCFQPTSWHGCFTLSMNPYSIDFTYGVGPEVERKACFLELWRRALNLEGALAKLVAYLDRVFECVVATSPSPPGHMPPRLSSVPPKVIGNVRSLLLAGAGLYGCGKAFWHEGLARKAYLEALPACGDPQITERIKWLQGGRAAAFEVLYPHVDELSLLPTLALVFSLREPLSHLNEETCRKQVLEIMKGERDSRVRLYSDCLGWLERYGGELTR